MKHSIPYPSDHNLIALTDMLVSDGFNGAQINFILGIHMLRYLEFIPFSIIMPYSFHLYTVFNFLFMLTAHVNYFIIYTYIEVTAVL